jgi:hypothetical protein
MTAIRTAALAVHVAARWLFNVHPLAAVLVLYLLAVGIAVTVAPGATFAIATNAWDWLAAVVGAVIGAAP